MCGNLGLFAVCRLFTCHCIVSYCILVSANVEVPQVESTNGFPLEHRGAYHLWTNPIRPIMTHLYVILCHSMSMCIVLLSMWVLQTSGFSFFRVVLSMNFGHPLVGLARKSSIHSAGFPQFAYKIPGDFQLSESPCNLHVFFGSQRSPSHVPGPTLRMWIPMPSTCGAGSRAMRPWEPCQWSGLLPCLSDVRMVTGDVHFD